MTKGGNTANICATDISKAFDRVNHHGLLIKLMNRLIPYELLTLLESWLSRCYACVSSLIACHMHWSLVPGLLIPTARRTQLFPFPFTPVTPLHPTPPNFFSSDFHESHDRVWCRFGGGSCPHCLPRDDASAKKAFNAD